VGGIEFLSGELGRLSGSFEGGSAGFSRFEGEPRSGPIERIREPSQEAGNDAKPGSEKSRGVMREPMPGDAWIIYPMCVLIGLGLGRMLTGPIAKVTSPKRDSN
jgi:hypothetical protein